MKLGLISCVEQIEETIIFTETAT